MLATPLEHATKPTEFAPTSNGVHAILTQLQEIIDKVEHEIELLNLNSDTASLAPTLSFTSGHSAGGSVVSLGSLGGSASQVGSGSSAVGSALSQSTIAGSSVLTGTIGVTPQDVLLGEWGCLTCDLQPEGNGYWFGNIYSGPADATYNVPHNTCPAVFAPNRNAQHKYCIFTPGACSHPPLPGVALATRVGVAATTQPQKGGGRGKGKGSKGRGGRANGRGRGRAGADAAASKPYGSNKRKVVFQRQQ